MVYVAAILESEAIAGERFETVLCAVTEQFVGDVEGHVRLRNMIEESIM